MSTQLAQYKLKGQPFDLGRYDTQRIGREIEWDRLRALVEEARSSKSPTIAVLLGTYGAGKSFLFWKLAESLRPTKKTRCLSSGPIRLIEPEQKREFIKNLVLRLFSRGLQVETDVAPVIEGVKAADIECSDQLRPYVHLVTAIASKKNAATARRVLTGARVLRKEAEQGGFSEIQQIKTNDQAIFALQAFQMVLGAAGVDVFVLLVDEVEYAEALPQSGRIAVLDSLKHLWDQEVEMSSKSGDAARLLMVLSATPTFWHNTVAQITSEARRGTSGVGLAPFIARIKKTDIIEMPPDLGAKEAKELIVTRMTEVREGGNRETIIPFTSDYVDYVYELSQGVPRSIIEICGVVLNEAANQKIKTVDKKTAKQLLRELLISYEPASKKP